jgi:hypothetical protein
MSAWRLAARSEEWAPEWAEAQRAVGRVAVLVALRERQDPVHTEHPPPVRTA